MYFKVLNKELKRQNTFQFA